MSRKTHTGYNQPDPEPAIERDLDGPAEPGAAPTMVEPPPEPPVYAEAQAAALEAAGRPKDDTVPPPPEDGVIQPAPVPGTATAPFAGVAETVDDTYPASLAAARARLKYETGKTDAEILSMNDDAVFEALDLIDSKKTAQEKEAARMNLLNEQAMERARNYVYEHNQPMTSGDSGYTRLGRNPVPVHA